MNTAPRFSPSQLGSLEKCPQFRSSPTESDVAQEGTLLHEALAKGTRNILQDPEHRALIDRCLAFLFEWEQEFSGFAMNWETPLEIPARPDIGVPRLTGTADLCGRKGDTAFIVDWKFGRNPVPEAQSNIQLQAYALAVFRAHPEVNLIHTAIVQPRLGLVDRGTLRREDQEKVLLRIAAIVARVNADSPATPEPSACLYCGRKSTCPALNRFAVQVGTTLGLPATLDPTAVTRPEDMAQLQRLAKVLEDWCAQVRAENLKRALDGVTIPGYRVMERRGAPSVTDPAAAAIALVQSGTLSTPEELLVCCRVNLPDLVEYVAAAKGGEKANIRDRIEHVLSEVLKFGEPVRFLQATRTKKEQ